ncbi:MAG: hypothetical protein GEV11_21285 [Streptosporangiales bacterium]|nr:hypothetical protein [Streptosporangiales bacterium]
MQENGDEQGERHRQTLANGATELQHGSSVDVRKLATNAKPIVQEHLTMLLRANGGTLSGWTARPGKQAANEPKRLGSVRFLPVGEGYQGRPSASS